MVKKNSKVSIKNKEVQAWIDEGLKKGYDLEYLMKIVDLYRIEKKAYDALKK